VALDEFERRITDEMDFRQEAAYARAIGERFAGNPRVVVPRVVDGMVRQRTLVLEYVKGTRVDRIEPLVDGLFHADPHPGNLLVRDDGALVLLDFGMVIEVDPERRRHCSAPWRTR
jgi:predicted unusual protein kinase regulating ubiquinone biosynthesis (AarF/ABC1/UbiB family)